VSAGAARRGDSSAGAETAGRRGAPGGGRPPVIAIDGPSGAGKSTVAACVARRTGLLHLDTGAMYRAVALAVLRAGLPGDPERLDAPAVLGAMAACGLEVDRRGARQEVRLGGRTVQAELRAPEVEALVPHVARLPDVRRALVPLQRGLARDGGVVAEGRDMATAVFPDAAFKFFVTADLEERARRRQAELRRRGVEMALPEVRRALEERDRLDSRRPVGALRRHPDAVVVDTTGLTIQEAVQRILDACSGAVLAAAAAEARRADGGEG
jgi:cytidylate kinase